MDEKFMETINKKRVYIPLIAGVVVLMSGLAFGTYYFFMRPTNTASSAVLVQKTTQSPSPAKVDNSTSTKTIEDDLKSVDSKSSSIDTELNSANSGLNDTQTNLVY